MARDRFYQLKKLSRTKQQVRNIQEDVNFYVESNQDPDFAEDEGIYDDLSLEEAEAYGFANEDEEGSEQSALEGILFYKRIARL
jgi:CCR4-NOT transcriptional regulation complex NOT5 subunit